MSRPKKDAKILNIKLAHEIYCDLERYSQETGINKTAATEMILSRYFEEYYKRQKER